MKTIRFAFSVLLLAFAMNCVPAVFAQITVAPMPSGNGLYLIHTVLPNPPGVFVMNNLLLVSPERVILTDTLPPGTYPLFINTIHGVTGGQRVDTLINSHWHFDHAGLNANFRTQEGTPTIIAHWRAGAYMMEGHCIENILCMPPLPVAAQPSEQVRGEMTLLPPNESIVVKTEENAHSGADVVIYLERANVVYTGDIYFGGMYPIIDRTAGGTVNGMLHALNQILARVDDSTIVVPSHGALGNRQTVLEFSNMLQTCRDLVRSLIARGMTEQQVMNDPSFAELDAKWGNGLIPGPLFREILYRDLAPAGNR